MIKIMGQSFFLQNPEIKLFLACIPQKNNINPPSHLHLNSINTNGKKNESCRSNNKKT